jgi:hypothetical protein
MNRFDKQRVRRACAKLSQNGISFDGKDYEELRARQKNSCAICCVPFGSIVPCIDHCHESKKVRGLLCHKCNVGLGFFADDIGKLASAARYLARFWDLQRIRVDGPV